MVIFCVPPGLWAWRQCRLVGTGCFGLRTVGRKTAIWVGVSISETWLDVNFGRFLLLNEVALKLAEDHARYRQITVWLMYFWSHYCSAARRVDATQITSFSKDIVIMLLRTFVKIQKGIALEPHERWISWGMTASQLRAFISFRFGECNIARPTLENVNISKGF